MRKKCVKCEEEGTSLEVTVDDGDLPFVMGVYMCEDCSNSLTECIIEMLYDEKN